MLYHIVLIKHTLHAVCMFCTILQLPQLVGDGNTLPVWVLLEFTLNASEPQSFYVFFITKQ